MRPVLIAFATALTSLAGLSFLPGTASAQTTSSRYVVEVAVMAKGVKIMSARTSIVEGGQAEVNLNGADGSYTFTADLQPEQGDGGDDRLVLDAYLNHDGADVANPKLVLTRNSRAVMQMGSQATEAPGLTEGVEIQITPIPAD